MAAAGGSVPWEADGEEVASAVVVEAVLEASEAGCQVVEGQAEAGRVDQSIWKQS